MKLNKHFTNLTLSMVISGMMLCGCGTMTNTQKGAAIGAGSATAVGAGVGALIGKDAKSSVIGAAIGAVIGTAAGALIGKRMDKKAEELSNTLDNATVETVTDANNLQAIKVTFESGILFEISSSVLNAASKKSLAEFAGSMKDLPDTNIDIKGHTDNTGTLEYNQKLSLERAQSVGNYLRSLGIAGGRLSEEGLDFQQPVADNGTREGRLQNRRVEVFISANENMIKKAEAETK